MKQFMTTVAGVFVGLALFFIGGPLLLLGWAASASKPAPVASRSVLVLDLREGVTDQAGSSPFAALSSHGVAVTDVDQTLRAAETDANIRGLLVRLPEGAIAPAAADELRAAFLRFRAAGKPIVAFGQGFYADGTVISTYELAAASGDVWMQPGSSFQAVGLAREDVFFKRFFDRHHVGADYQQRYEYKTAVNPFLYEDYTDAHRQSELSWMSSVYQSALAAAAADRHQGLARLRSSIEAGPYGAEIAMARGLIDHVGQEPEAEAALLAKAGSGAKLVEFADYQANVQSRSSSAFGIGDPVIAIISVEGDIMTGTGSGGAPSFGGAQVIHSDDVQKAFRAAVDDSDVKAIVFRISSPGGSDTASEQILAAVRAAKAAGKPVVVSMGTYAASGGYWIASQASEIVAQPTTLTGSIGVFGGKFALGPALADFGVDMRGLKVGGDYADASASRAPMSASQHAATSAWMDTIYNGFISRVAQGRKLSPDRVREIAKGRVWTGEQGKTLGLVDRVGGFYDAVDEAKRLAGVKGGARLRSFNPETSPWRLLKRLLGGSAELAHVAASIGGVASDPSARAVMSGVSDAQLRAQGATVLAPRWVN